MSKGAQEGLDQAASPSDMFRKRGPIPLHGGKQQKKAEKEKSERSHPQMNAISIFCLPMLVPGHISDPDLDIPLFLEPYAVQPTVPWCQSSPALIDRVGRLSQCQIILSVFYVY